MIFGILMSVTMEVVLYGDVTPCRLIEVYGLSKMILLLPS
jgi:hypothetical protein